ncbi:hypothetical protein ELE36_00815 [Pseudolysobacter antarcticus]|uniref:Uncharacterized protein n=1 Tax=Pseudolysobacter antarcticus TaxID=2511995 RepID=A0A411HEY7_9GAMM|nr:hypothetical protein [Pseudolysobacter antarcticus]QBB69037.1 hypothetical protein ELE36_00815 [Pseudolysobacter antarcticus]
MGGAIFNHTGTVVLRNVTATGNTASGYGGSGLGAVIFNLNGAVTVEFSTLAGNFLSGNAANTGGPEDATVYSLAYGNNLLDGTLSMASLTVRNSIIRGTHPDSGSGNDVLINAKNGAHTNAASVVYVGKNLVQFSANLGNATQTGSAPLTTDPLLGPLHMYGDSPLAMPTLAIGANSPATDAATDCLESDGVTTLTTDARGAPDLSRAIATSAPSSIRATISLPTASSRRCDAGTQRRAASMRCAVDLRRIVSRYLHRRMRC